MTGRPTFEKQFEPWCLREGEDPVVPLFDHGGSMSKVASSLDHVPELQKYINKAKPEKGWYTLLIHANGTDEVWGPNRKGDAFPEKWLVPTAPNAPYGYKTFETDALGYVHHRNKPERWTGRVVMAEFSRPMGRVELIARFNIQRLIEEAAPYFVDMLESGTLPAVSMGCRVPFDSCSICGNNARNILEYCEHLKYSRLATLEDGRRVRMFNVRPVFHDISLVSSPADPAARVLLKVAENVKHSAIEKRAPAEAVGGIRRFGPKEYAATVSTAHDPDLVLPLLLRAAKLNKHASLTTLTALGIILRPHEFATIEYARSGNLLKAAEVYNSKTEFPVYESRMKTASFVWSYPDEGLVQELKHSISSRSIYIPAYEERMGRIGLDKIASTVLPERLYRSDVGESIQYEYANYRKVAEQALLDGTAGSWVRNRPDILTLVLNRDIPMVIKVASLDEPKVVFGQLIRGAYVTSNLQGV